MEEPTIPNNYTTFTTDKGQEILVREYPGSYYFRPKTSDLVHLYKVERIPNYKARTTFGDYGAVFEVKKPGQLHQALNDLKIYHFYLGTNNCYYFLNKSDILRLKLVLE